MKQIFQNKRARWGLALAALVIAVMVVAWGPPRSIIRTGILCDSGETNCVEAQGGMNLIVYSDAGTTQKFKVTGSNGNVDVAGGQANSSWVNIAAPTAIASATPALVVNSAGVSNLFEARKNATPMAAISGTGIGTLAGGLTVSAGTVSLPASEIGIAEIADISRTVPIPLGTFFECTTNAGAALAYTDGTDAHPFYSNSSTDGLGRVIAFDATSGSPDTDYICSDTVVPQDFASGALFVVRATKGAETGANSEVINCQGSINGAALGTAGTVTTSGTAIAAYSCTPTLTSLAAGDALAFTLRITSGGTADDTVNIVSVEFRYTATQ